VKATKNRRKSKVSFIFTILFTVVFVISSLLNTASAVSFKSTIANITGTDNTSEDQTKKEEGITVTDSKTDTPNLTENPEDTTIDTPSTIENPEDTTIDIPSTTENTEDTTIDTPSTIENPEDTTVDTPSTIENPTDTIIDTPNSTENLIVTTSTKLDDYSETPIVTNNKGISTSLTIGESGESTYVVDPSTKDTDLLPGQVKMTKVATPVAGKVNTWDIKLRVVGRTKTVTSDIVLVIDRSGSMEDSVNGTTRIQAAKNAANTFVSTVLGADSKNNRIAVVSFAGDTNTDSGFSSNINPLRNSINKLSASGGTLTQGGIRTAQNLLSNSSATKKNIILLSDGAPTYGYEITNLNNYKKSWTHTISSSNPNVDGTYTNDFETTSTVPQSSFNYNTVVGNGSERWSTWYGDQWLPQGYTNGTVGWPYLSNPTRYASGLTYYNFGNSAIAQSGYAKAAGSTVYTISLYAGADGTEILNSIASPGKAYASDNESLNSIFGQIAGQLGSPVSSATVTDPMASGFVINYPSSIIATNGATTNYDSNTKTLKWNIDSLTKVLDSTRGIKYEELNYRIEISEDTPTNAISYPTNGTTPMSFYDIDGMYCKNNFQIPTVDPVFVTVGKVLHDVNGNEKSSTDKFSIKISTSTPQNVLVTTDDNPVVTLKQVWNVGNYTITENPSNPTDRYTLKSVKINNVTKNTISLAIDGPDQNIVLTNKDGSVTATANKVWNGGPANKPETWFKLYRQPSNGGSVEEVPISEAPIKHITNGVTSITWNNLTKYNPSGIPYIFSVKEVNSTGEDYTPNGYDKIENGLTVTNIYKPSIIILKTSSFDDTPLSDVEFKLYEGDNSGYTGSSLDLITTDSEGKATFSNLKDGTYWLVESKPPIGYRLINDIGPIVVSNGEVTGIDSDILSKDETTGNYIITVENEPIQKLPATGGIGSILFVAGGLVLMIIAIYLGIIKKHIK
jgi:LPXTG-motif cell wall-anchored protein